MINSHRPPFARTILTAASSLALAVTMSVPAAAAPPDIDDTPGGLSQALGGSTLDGAALDGLKVQGPLGSATGDVSVFVQFAGDGAFAQTQPAAVREGKAKPVEAKAKVKQIREGIRSKGRDAAREAQADIIYTTTNTIPGVALKGNADKLRSLAARADVVKITAIVPKKPTNKGAVVDTQALAAWQSLEQTGEGVTIAVLDTGIDYTHASFGGPGTLEAYEKAQASTELPTADSGLRDPQKFIGGWDLVGDDYDAGSSVPGNQVPQPDPNPLDCETAGHGTHVAGSAAGYGVDAEGKTFRGDHTDLTAEDVAAMDVGPGTAPQAQLVGIRVFGCAGSSSVVGQALDYVLDPNRDGDFSDRAQIVNMSLGSDHSPVDDPENDIVDALTEQGILSVVASGNAGDVTDVGGGPGNARSALTVANSVGSHVTLDGVEVLAPADAAGDAAGQYSVNFNYNAATEEQLTGTVVMGPADNKFGCDPIPAGTYSGEWVWLQWEEDGAFPCGSGVRFNNVAAAGGAGVVLDSPNMVFDAGIAGNAAIPGVQLNQTHSDALRPAAEAGTLQLRLDPELIGAAFAESQALDTLNPGSSRGVHGSEGVVKPDVAAPGTSISSAGVATGNGPAVMTGTSMATPHTAGIAALVAGSGDFTPYEVKSIVMNTAAEDILAANGAPFGPARVGSGRVIADAALETPAHAYATDAPDLTSLVFGVIELGERRYSETESITVENTSDRTRTYAVDYVPATEIPGASYRLDRDRVTVRPGKSAKINVTLRIDPDEYAKTLDPTMERAQSGIPRAWVADVSGRVELTANGLPALRVPVHAAPKPASDMGVGRTINVERDGTGEVRLRGDGVLVGSGNQQVVSLLSAFELGVSSGRMGRDIDAVPGGREMDVQYAGAASDAQQVGAAKGTLSYGVSTWGNWAHLAGGTQIEILTDTNMDGKADYSTFTAFIDGIDLDLAATFRISDGAQVDLLPVNNLYGDTDSNTFDTNVVSLPVSLTNLGIGVEHSGNVQYQVVTWSSYNTDEDGRQVPVEQTDWVPYNVLEPRLWFEGRGEGNTFVDLPGLRLAAHLGEPTAPQEPTGRKGKDTEVKALFLHHHNATGDLRGKGKQDGGKAEVATVQQRR